MREQLRYCTVNGRDGDISGCTLASAQDAVQTEGGGLCTAELLRRLPNLTHVKCRISAASTFMKLLL